MGKIETATQWMINLANDDTHGYDQTHRWGPDYDCSSAIITAWENAGVPVKSKGAGATGTMYSPFLNCGFSDVTSKITLASGKGLENGDVLLRTGSSGHTAMYIGNSKIVHASINENGTTTGGQTGDQTGKEICTRSYYNSPWTYVLRYTGGGGGSTGDSTIKSFQTWLNNNYSAGLTADGIYGSNTKKAATIAYQRFLGVTADGIFGASSKAAVKTLSSGSKGNAVYLLQGMLYCQGFNPNGVDGTFGAGTTSAVKSFQASEGLTADGIAGANTMYALYN
jgi:hypothetical protein